MDIFHTYLTQPWDEISSMIGSSKFPYTLKVITNHVDKINSIHHSIGKLSNPLDLYLFFVFMESQID